MSGVVKESHPLYEKSNFSPFRRELTQAKMEITNATVEVLAESFQGMENIVSHYHRLFNHTIAKEMQKEKLFCRNRDQLTS